MNVVCAGPPVGHQLALGATGVSESWRMSTWWCLKLPICVSARAHVRVCIQSGAIQYGIKLGHGVLILLTERWWPKKACGGAKPTRGKERRAGPPPPTWPANVRKQMVAHFEVKSSHAVNRPVRCMWKWEIGRCRKVREPTLVRFLFHREKSQGTGEGLMDFSC